MSVLASALLYWIALDHPCEQPVVLPVAIEETATWRITTHGAWAGGQLYELVEPTYLPHGGTFMHSFWIDDDRQWPTLNVPQYVETNRIPQPRVCPLARDPLSGTVGA
jgi:hypothetical protein